MAKASAVSEAKAVLDSKEPTPIIAVSSFDRIRRDRFLARYLEKFFPEGTGVSTIDSRVVDSKAIRGLASASNSLSLFSTKSLLVLRHAHELKAADAKEIATIIRGMGHDQFSIIEGAKLGEKSPLVTLAAQKGKALSFTELKGPELRRWITKELSLAGITKVSDDALEILITFSDEDLDTLAHHIELAGLYVEQGTLGRAELLSLFRGVLHTNDFEIGDRWMDGKSGRARVLLAESLHEGGNPFGIIAILSRLATQVATVRAEQQKNTDPSKIREMLGMSPWQYTKVSDYARKHDMTALLERTRRLLRADCRLKSRSISVDGILDGGLCD